MMIESMPASPVGYPQFSVDSKRRKNQRRNPVLLLLSLLLLISILIYRKKWLGKK